MTDTELSEECECGTNLIKTSADDDANPHDSPVVVCPACMDIKRIE